MAYASLTPPAPIDFENRSPLVPAYEPERLTQNVRIIEAIEAQKSTSARIVINEDLTNDVTDTRVLRELSRIGAVDKLYVDICSQGGHIICGDRIAAAIRKHPAKRKITRAIGKCWSAAVKIFDAGDDRLMTPGACLMLHLAHRDGDTTPDASIVDSSDIRRMFQSRMPDVQPAWVREWQCRETYFSDASALAYGLATGLDLASRAAMSFDIPDSRKPLPVTDCWATRAFAEKCRRAGTKEPVVPPIRKVMTKRASPAKSAISQELGGIGIPDHVPDDDRRRFLDLRLDHGLSEQEALRKIGM